MDDNKSLLDTLSSERLPAIPSEPAEPQEPAEPREVSTVEEQGKSPDEVVQPREARLPATDEPAAAPAAKPAEKLYEVRGVKYTLKQLEEAGLLEDLTQTHSQHQHLQEKYHKLLEEKTGQPAPQKEAQQPAAVPQITNDMIARTYDPIAGEISNDLIAKNLVEGDLFEAYPRAMRTMIGQLRYAFDVIFSNQQKLEQLIAETSGAKQKVQGQIVANAYNAQLDALVKKDAKLFGGLSDPKTRQDFTDFLTTKVGATIGQTTGDEAPDYLRRQWVAFNADTLLGAAKTGVTERQKTANKRAFVGGEGTGSRMGTGDSGETTLLDRLTSSKLGE